MSMAFGRPGALRAAFIYRTSIDSDHCWAEAHEISRRAVAVELGDAVELISVEEVADEAVTSVAEALIGDGVDVIYACSMSYGRAIDALATKYPDTIFEVCQGTTLRPNVGVFRAAVDESAYVSGILAGAASTTGRLGMVGATGGPNELAFLDAWARGVARSRPEARIAIRWTGSWDDAVAEVEAVEALVASGADVIGGALTENAAIPRAAARLGVLCMTRNVDRRFLAPGSIVDVTTLDWRQHYAHSLRSILEGRWVARYRHYHYDSGVVGNLITESLVPEYGRALARAAADELRAGISLLWNGEICDNHGGIVVPEGASLGDRFTGATMDGQTPDEAALLAPSLNWLFENIAEEGPRP